MARLKRRSAVLGLLLLAACSPPAKSEAPPAAAPAPIPAAAPPSAPPAAQIPADAPAEPMAGPRQPLTILTTSGPKAFQVELVNNDATRAQGLMFRRSMAPDHGMLFDFISERPVYFWMKNTYIPLDMVFIAADGTIAAIASNTTPLSEAPVGPGVPVRGVLELNAGRAAAVGIHPGDKVQHPIFKAP